MQGSLKWLGDKQDENFGRPALALVEDTFGEGAKLWNFWICRKMFISETKIKEQEIAKYISLFTDLFVPVQKKCILSNFVANIAMLVIPKSISPYLNRSVSKFPKILKFSSQMMHVSPNFPCVLPSSNHLR